ncbi:MAG TPA: hypothetical protein VFS05_04810 [Gemmatimonadaceae bacterium]|nr:hypothetical protein [Gemmatimonadaceae bacterium]
MSFRSALREVLRRAPGVRPVTEGGAPLERMASDPEAPRVVDAQVVEHATLRARRVPGEPAPGFVAFLDGAQESHVVAWHLAAPIVEGRVSAAIRARVSRRLRAWGEPVVERRVYLPFVHTDPAPWEAGFPPGVVKDTTADEGEVPPAHPVLLLERARQAVSRDRDALEQRLAGEWCAAEDRPLFIDGGIGGNAVVAAAPCVVGVIKSHRTLWVGGAALAAVLALGPGERSSVFRIPVREHSPGRRTSAVLSWYLRLRDPAGRDTLWGLVRVEVAETEGDVTARADEVSRWVLAETTPLALPDARWDKMVYGIRNTEEYLRAI